MDAEAASLMDQMMKSRETLRIKTLETKLIIIEKKKEVKLAKVRTRRQEAKCKVELDERMLTLKEANALKELLAEEKEIMMSTKDMDDDQLAWWKEIKVDIMERKRLLRQGRGGASTPRGESPMSGGGGDGGLDHSTDVDA